MWAVIILMVIAVLLFIIARRLSEPTWKKIVDVATIVAAIAAIMTIVLPDFFNPMQKASPTFWPTVPATSSSTIADNMIPTLAIMPGDKLPPKFFGFQACPDPCDGTNAEEAFPEKIVRVYFQWNYENVPTGAHYVRSWEVEGRGEWVKYDCEWPGPASEQDNIPIYDRNGLPSGTWVMTITLNGEELMREQITIEGDWENWKPAGTFLTCYFDH